MRRQHRKQSEQKYVAGPAGMGKFKHVENIKHVCVNDCKEHQRLRKQLSSQGDKDIITRRRNPFTRRIKLQLRAQRIRRYKENKEQYLKDLAEDSNNKIEDLKYLDVDYVGYFCTSSAIVSENLNISNNPAGALVEEAKLKNIKKCLLITPYNDELGSKVKKELEGNYINVNRIINLNLINTKDYFDFGKNKLEKFIINNYQSDDGDIIISCTNLPTLHFISNVERKLNVKVISSNSSLFSKIIRENL